MSFIDSKNIETCITDASIDSLTSILEEQGYKITKTNLQLTAIDNNIMSSYKSTITILDRGTYRDCTDIEISNGWALNPHTGVLANIVNKAEELERINEAFKGVDYSILVDKKTDLIKFHLFKPCEENYYFDLKDPKTGYIKTIKVSKEIYHKYNINDKINIK